MDDHVHRALHSGYGQERTEALDCLEIMRPDAIVLDLMLPVLIGWDVVGQYRARTDRRIIPMIVVSAAGVSKSMEALGLRLAMSK